VLGVASERKRLVALSSRVSEQVNKTVVISSCDDVVILGEINTIDVSSISSVREDAINEPAELGVASGPLCANSV